MFKNLSVEKKTLFWFWGLLLFPILVISLIFTLIITGHMGFMPTFEELENPKNFLAAEVIAEDSVVLGKYYYQNRSFASYNELSPNLVKALLATEDFRFSKHSGIDFKATLRVAYGVLTGNSKGGGSTITQQLAKNLFPRDTAFYSSRLKRTFSLATTKFKEWVTAVKLERNYTKEEILVMYLNTVPFGSQAFGIKSASKTFFNSTPADIKIEQAALLVGLLKAPSYYNPVRNPNRSIYRRNVVLAQMLKYKFISSHQFDSISALPLGLNYMVQSHTEGLATYFREYLRIVLTANKPDKRNYWSAEQFREDSLEWEVNPLYGWCNKNLKPDGTPFSLYKDGLKIYTTIHSRMQTYAEQAVFEHLGKDLQPAFFSEKRGKRTAPFSSDLTPEEVKHIMNLSMKRSERYRVLKNRGVSADSILKNFRTKTEMTVFTWNGERDTIMSPYDSLLYYKHFLHSGFLSIDPHTGYVKAYVGGINYEHFQYDHVKLSRRQVGSTFKPFLYTLAMQEGYSPCYQVPNVPTTFVLSPNEVWTPRNSSLDKFDRKMVTLKWGLANSVNNISAWLMKQFKPGAVIDVVRLMGVKSPLPAVPSLCLGVADLSLYEMVGAYGTFANNGVFIEPTFVTRIEDKNGNVLASFKPNKTEAFNAQTAYLMVTLLKGVVKQGTGMRLRGKYQLKNEIAGKTGTTNNHSDGWFMGLTPNLVSGTWTGGEDRSIHFDNLKIGQGSNMALPIWALYMQKIYADTSLGISPEDKFETPDNFNIQTTCDEDVTESSQENSYEESEFFD